MKKILSKSKMREKLPLKPEGGKARFAIFEKGKETELSEPDFDFLKGKKNGPFSFLLKEGTFVIVQGDDAVEEKPQLSKKQQKKLDHEAKVAADKAAAETANERQGE